MDTYLLFANKMERIKRYYEARLKVFSWSIHLFFCFCCWFFYPFTFLSSNTMPNKVICVFFSFLIFLVNAWKYTLVIPAFCPFFSSLIFFHAIQIFMVNPQSSISLHTRFFSTSNVCTVGSNSAVCNPEIATIGDDRPHFLQHYSSTADILTTINHVTTEKISGKYFIVGFFSFGEWLMRIKFENYAGR